MDITLDELKIIADEQGFNIVVLYFDLYYIIKKEIPIDIRLIKRKFKLDGENFSIFLIFKNTNKVFNKWNDDLFMLTKTRLSFQEVMKALAEHFKLKEEKEKLKAERKETRN